MLESLTDLPVKNWEELWRYCGDSMWKSVEMIWAELKTSCSWGTPSPVHFRLPQCGVRTSSEVVMWTKPSGNHRVNHHNCAETLSWRMADVQLQMNQRYTCVSLFSCHFIFVTSASSRWFCFGVFDPVQVTLFDTGDRNTSCQGHEFRVPTLSCRTGRRDSIHLTECPGGKEWRKRHHRKTS